MSDTPSSRSEEVTHSLSAKTETQVPAISPAWAKLGADATPVDSAATGGFDENAPAPAMASGFVSLPGYEILAELGRGGMGVVYKAARANSTGSWH